MSARRGLADAVRMGAFPLGYGLVGALAGGTLNRIMVAEMGLPVTLVGFLFALPLLEAPLRVWLGYRSDGYPIFGRRREPYIVVGALLAAVGIVSAVGLMTAGLETGVTLVAGLVLMFALYGFGRNLAHNAFQALVADKFVGDTRARALTLYEVATMLGLVVGAGGLGVALEDYSTERLLAAGVATMAAVLFLTVIAAIGQERRGNQVEAAAARARATTFAAAVRDILLADPQVRLFFVLIVFTFVGTLAQDVLLEPYGALVLGMSVSGTTQLTAFWGAGVLVSMLLSGVVLLPRLGPLRLLRIGLVCTLTVFIGIIAAGLSGHADGFRALVGLLGLGTGLAGAGMLGAIAGFATHIRAGLLMGVWGMASLLGKAFGSIMGGAVVDTVMVVSGGEAFVAYASVFILEAVMLLLALLLSYRLRIEASTAAIEERTAAGPRERVQLPQA